MSAAGAPWVRYLVAFLLCALCLAGVLLPVETRVMRPRLGVPSVLAPGETFVLELESSAPFARPTVRAALERPGTPAVGLDLELAAANGARHSFAVRVPAALAEGAWTLVVHLDAASERLPRAVHLRSAWPDELSLVQLADLPEFWPDGSGARAMERLVTEINLVAPDLVLLSGDLAYGGSRDRYAGLMAAMERFEAPVIAGIGNHEYQGLAGFMASLRLPNHVVDAGPLRVISANSAHGRDQLTLTQLDWIAAALEGAGGRTPLVQLHHPLFDRRSLGARRDAFVELCRAHGVPIVLSGHLHADRVFDAAGRDRRDRPDFEGTAFAVVTAAGARLRPEMSSGGDYHGYRVVRLARARPDGPYRLVSYTYDLDGDGVLDASASHPAGKLTIAPLAPGAVRATNGWNEPVPRARLWIDLPPGRRPELPAGLRGLGTRQRPDGSGALQAGVELDLAAGASVDVRVLP